MLANRAFGNFYQMTKIMIRKFCNWLAPITIIVDWEDVIVMHKAWSREDALAWCACYDVSAIVHFRNRLGAIQGFRA